MWPNPQFPRDLVTFTEEILSGKFHFIVQWWYSNGLKSEKNNPVRISIKKVQLQNVEILSIHLLVSMGLEDMVLHKSLEFKELTC